MELFKNKQKKSARVVHQHTCIATLMTVIPGYRVWSQEMRGKAALREAEQNRKIVIEEAKARLEAEQLNAEAEVARAKGMAEAMEIENGQLTPTYNQYLFIRTLEALAQQGDLPQLIYLPSQGMVPVMDLTRPNDVNITMQQEE